MHQETAAKILAADPEKLRHSLQNMGIPPGGSQPLSKKAIDGAVGRLMELQAELGKDPAVSKIKVVAAFNDTTYQNAVDAQIKAYKDSPSFYNGQEKPKWEDMTPAMQATFGDVAVADAMQNLTAAPKTSYLGAILIEHQSDSISNAPKVRIDHAPKAAKLANFPDIKRQADAYARMNPGEKVAFDRAFGDREDLKQLHAVKLKAYQRNDAGTSILKAIHLKEKVTQADLKDLTKAMDKLDVELNRQAQQVIGAQQIGGPQPQPLNAGPTITTTTTKPQSPQKSIPSPNIQSPQPQPSFRAAQPTARTGQPTPRIVQPTSRVVGPNSITPSSQASAQTDQANVINQPVTNVQPVINSQPQPSAPVTIPQDQNQIDAPIRQRANNRAQLNRRIKVDASDIADLQIPPVQQQPQQRADAPEKADRMLQRRAAVGKLEVMSTRQALAAVAHQPIEEKGPSTNLKASDGLDQSGEKSLKQDAGAQNLVTASTATTHSGDKSLRAKLQASGGLAKGGGGLDQSGEKNKLRRSSSSNSLS
jgi:hypothetical protein